MVDGENTQDLTLDEFIALIQFINRKLEALNKEAAKLYKLSRQASSLYGGSGDIMKLLLESTLASRASSATAASTASIEEDEEVKRRAKEIARRVVQNEDKKAHG